MIAHAMKHAYARVTCTGCERYGKRTTILIRYLGTHKEGAVYTLYEIPLGFNVPCDECGTIGHYERNNVELFESDSAPPADYADMV